MLISVATLIATLPTAVRAQAEPPGALDLATLPGTLDYDYYIHLAYQNGTWAYKLGAYDTEPTSGTTPFNGTITGTMPNATRQFLIHPAAGGAQPTLTLKDATITSSFNQLFHILAGAKLTLRIEGDNRIEIDNSLIWNLGTLTLIVADALEISQGIDNGFYNGGITSTLTVDAQAPLSISSIGNNKDGRIHLDGEIQIISKMEYVAAFFNDNNSPDAITFGDNARISLQANNAPCTNVRGFIELAFDTAPDDGQTLSVTPVGGVQPATTFATDGTFTIASGTVTLQNNTSNAHLSGTHALRVETGATCLIPPPTDPDHALMLTATEQAIHPEGGGTVKSLVQFTWPEPLSVFIDLSSAEPTEDMHLLHFISAGKKSIATNYPLSFYLENMSTLLKQEGYRSDDPEQTYLSTFPAAHPDEQTSYTGLRDIPPVWIVIDKETAFDESMQNQWLRITEKGVLTVGKIEGNYVQYVNDLELLDGGQIRFADDGVMALRAVRFTRIFPNRNQWRATTIASNTAGKLASDAGTPCYARTGYPDTTDQTWQPAEPDDLYMLDEGDPVLIAGEGPETDTLRLNYNGTYLYKDSPDYPIEPTSPAEPLNTGVFLFKGNLASYNVEMRNIYVLSDDGSRFELKDQVTLRPFESYVVANAATQALLKSLRLDGIATGTELAETPADNSFRAWAADGRLHLSADHAEKVAVYHISGTLRCYLPLLCGETTIALPSGIYLVRQGGTTIKVVL